MSNQARAALTFLAFAICTVLVWGGGLFNPFQGDDAPVILTWLRTREDLPSLLEQFTFLQWGFFYRPFTGWLYDRLLTLFYPQTWPFHLLALAVHTFGAYAVMRLAQACTGQALASLFAAFVFLALPAHAEPILWISGLHGMLENVLSLWALVLLIEGRRGSLNPVKVLAGMGLFAVALATKETAAFVVGALIAHDVLWWGSLAPRAKRTPILVAQYASLILCVAAYLVGLRSVLHGWSMFSINTFDIGFLAAACVRTIAACFSPFTWQATEQSVLSVIGTGLGPRLIVIALSMIPLVVALLRRNKAQIWLWLCVWGAIAPLMLEAIVPAERHTYTPSAFAAILVGIGFQAVANRTKTTRWAFGCLMLWSVIQVSASRSRAAAWTTAADHRQKVVEQTQALLPQLDQNDLLLILGVPDQIDGALVARFDNLRDFLRIAYQNDDLRAHMIATPEDIPTAMLAAPGAVQFTIAAKGRYLYWPPWAHGRLWERYDRDLATVGMLVPSPLVSTWLAKDRRVRILVYDAPSQTLRLAGAEFTASFMDNLWEQSYTGEPAPVE